MKKSSSSELSFLAFSAEYKIGFMYSFLCAVPFSSSYFYSPEIIRLLADFDKTNQSVFNEENYLLGFEVDSACLICFLSLHAVTFV